MLDLIVEFSWNNQHTFFFFYIADTLTPPATPCGRPPFSDVAYDVDHDDNNIVVVRVCVCSVRMDIV